MFKRIVPMLLFCTAAFFVIMACSIGPLSFGSQAEPTAVRRATRVARATFTPRPAATDTPEPEPTEEPLPTEEPQPTEEPEPTDVPVTVAPQPQPTRVPAQPTAVPPPPQPTAVPPPPQPTAVPPTPGNAYRYGFVRHECTHSGGSHIFVVVFSDYKNPDSQLAGARVVASYAPDSPAFGDTVGVTGGDGSFDYVMAEPGVWTGTVYAWVVDANNNRISSIGGPVELNDKGPDEPGTCHHAKFFFAGGAP